LQSLVGVICILATTKKKEKCYRRLSGFGPPGSASPCLSPRGTGNDGHLP
jgi:hypothetical protein